MAANPNLPDYPDIPPRPKNDHPKVIQLKRGKFPWPLLAILVGLAILATIILYLGRPSNRPAAGIVSTEPTAQQIQLTNMRMTVGPAGGAVYLQALLHNAGNSEIVGAQIEGRFIGNNGQSLEAQTGTVQVVTQSGGSEDLTQAPIRPNESRPVRIYFNHTPQGWNRQPPQLRVLNVTGTAA